MDKLQIGDIVVLKSGGPKMTVSNIGDWSYKGADEEVLCVWFEGTDCKEKVFHIETLRKESK